MSETAAGTSQGAHAPGTKQTLKERLITTYQAHKGIYLGGLLTLLAIGLIGGYYVLNPEGISELLPTPTPAPTIMPFNGTAVQTPDSGMTIEAESADSMGVTADTTFVLASNEPITPEYIDQHLKLDPPLGFTTQVIDANRVRIIPSQVLGANLVQQFELVAENGEATNDEAEPPSSWAFQTKDTFRVEFSLPRNEAVDVPIDSGIEVTFNDDRYQDPSTYILIEPPIDYTIERHKRTMVIVPTDPLAPATVYTVRIDRGLGIVDSNVTLGEEYVFGFETQASEEGGGYGDDAFVFDFDRQFVEVATNEAPAVGVYSYNFPENQEVTLAIEVYQYTTIDAYIDELNRRQTIPTWAKETWRNDLAPVSDLQKVSEVTLVVQQGRYQGYVVFPDPFSAGYYLVRATHDGETFRQVLLQVTDLSAYLAVSKTTSLIWVHNQQQDAPEPGVIVNLIGGNLSAETNQQGIASFNTPATVLENDQANYFQLLSRHGEILILPANKVYQNYYSLWMDGWYPTWGVSDDFWTYLYTDRELYMPNDTVHFWGVAKDRDQPNNKPVVEVKLTRSGYWYGDSNEVPVEQVVLTTSDFGTFTGSIDLHNLKPDWYTLRLYVDGELIENKGFEVKRYEKPAYTIAVEVEPKAVFAGTPVTFTGRVTFFEGTPVPGMEVSYNGSLEGDAVTNSTGTFELEKVHAYSPGTSYPHSDYLYVRPRLSDEGDMTGQMNVQVFGANIEVDGAVDYVEAGKVEVTFTVNEIDLSEINRGEGNNYLGDPVPDQTIEGELFKYHYERYEKGQYYDFINKKVQKEYEYRRVSEKVKDVTVRTDAQGMVQASFSTQEGYSYELKTTAIDADGRVARENVFAYHNGDRYSYSGGYDDRADNYYLSLNKEQAVYQLNESVVAEIKQGPNGLPEGQGERYLFIRSQVGIREYQVQNAPVFAATFNESYVPNVYLRAVYYDGHSYFETSPQGLDYDHNEKELTIDVIPDKERYEPGEQTTLSINTYDKDGERLPAAVNVSVVDEAMFALREQYSSILRDLYANVSQGILQTYYSHEYPQDAAVGERGAACFTKGTLVRMANGTTKEIDQIRVGDRIATLPDPNAKELVADEVTGVDQHQVTHVLVINSSLWVTPEHRFFINGRWQEIGLAKVGDWLKNEQGRWTTINQIEHHYGDFDVYNLHVKTYKTFIADDYYVHNQKGGRINFEDTAYFGSIETNAQGTGTVSFTLPDNITSWRATYLGISQAMHAGQGDVGIPVSLPFFIKATIGTEYLVDDQPRVRLSAFGDALNNGEEIIYQIRIPTLGIDDPVEVRGKAFETVYYPLPALVVGEHAITISASSGGMQDQVTDTFQVVQSRMLRVTADYQELSDITQLTSPETIQRLVFTDETRGRYYPMVNGLRWYTGERVDQKIAQVKGNELFTTYFEVEDNDSVEVGFESALYQFSDGGISLLPYSGTEVELSAKVGTVYAEGFDTVALQEYFWSVINDEAASIEQVTAAFYGLAAIHQPTLVTLQHLSQQDDLGLIPRLYIGLGLATLGDKVPAWEIYKDILETYGEEADPYLRINTGIDQDDVIHATSLTAMLGALLDDSRSKQMIDYVDDHQTRDILTVLEQIAYLEEALPATDPTSAGFTYSVDGETYEKTLENGRVVQVELTTDQYRNVAFSNITGIVGLGVLREVPFTASEVTPSQYITVDRSYYIDNQKISTGETINQDDLVRVRINYRIDDKGYDGCYVVTDFLPSGLRPVTKLYQYGASGETEGYLYQIDGQKMKYCVWQDNDAGAKQDYLQYFARVIAPGEYVGENTIMQSAKVVGDMTWGNTTNIKIK